MVAGRRADRLLRAGAVRLERLPRSARLPRGRPDRGRRGALRLGVGARLPARLPAAARGGRAAGAADGDGLHGDGDGAGRARDRLALRDAGAAPGPLRLRPPEPLLRRRRARGQGLDRAAPGDARGRAARPGQPAGDRLLRHPQADRRGGGGAARRRDRRGRLPRRPRTRAPDGDPGALHGHRHRRHLRHQRLRDGRRQARRALGLARDDPDQRRGLLPGGRTRRARRPALAGDDAGAEIRPRPPRPLQRTARRRPRPGGRPRARLARLPRDQGLHLRHRVPPPRPARPLLATAPRGRRWSAAATSATCSTGCRTRRRSRSASRRAPPPRPRPRPTSPPPTRRSSRR